MKMNKIKYLILLCMLISNCQLIGAVVVDEVLEIGVFSDIDEGKKQNKTIAKTKPFEWTFYKVFWIVVIIIVLLLPGILLSITEQIEDNKEL